MLKSALNKVNLHGNCSTMHINLYILCCVVYDLMFTASYLPALGICSIQVNKPTAIKYLYAFVLP